MVMMTVMMPITMKRMCHAKERVKHCAKDPPGGTRQLTYVLGREEESFPVELLVLCLFGRAVDSLLLLGLGGVHHARHLDVAVLLAEPHCGCCVWRPCPAGIFGESRGLVEGSRGGNQLGLGAQAGEEGSAFIIIVVEEGIRAAAVLGVGGGRARYTVTAAVVVVVARRRDGIGEKDHVVYQGLGHETGIATSA
jgi:hypothetical protein